MTITEESWKKYIANLRTVNDKAADEMAKYIKKWTPDQWQLPNIRQAILDKAYALSTKYGEAAAELACEMYDAMGLLSGMTLPAAEPAATATYGEVAKAVNGTMKSKNIEMVSAALGRLVKMAGVDTTMQNALRDGAQWAWIPSGDTCAFCIMLASNGWQTASKRAVRKGHAQHIHANCDCTYAVRFNNDTDVQGYDDGKKFREMYYDGAGISEDIWEEANDEYGKQENVFLSAYRRQAYQKNKAEINRQKRSAYAKRKELNLSRAEEMNVNT